MSGSGFFGVPPPPAVGGGRPIATTAERRTIVRVAGGMIRSVTVRSETLRIRAGALRPVAEPTVNPELNPLFAHFAHELRRLRVKRGWSQEALGKRIGFSGEMVSKVETGRNAPSTEFADALDRMAFSELE